MAIIFNSIISSGAGAALAPDVTVKSDYVDSTITVPDGKATKKVNVEAVPYTKQESIDDRDDLTAYDRLICRTKVGDDYVDYTYDDNKWKENIFKYEVSDCSYLCLRSFNEDKMYLFKFNKPTSIAYMFWENDTWNDIDLSKYFNEDEGNLTTEDIPMDHICYLHNTLTTFKFPANMQANTLYSAFQACTKLISIDWNGLKVNGPMTSLLNSCSSMTSVDLSGMTIMKANADIKNAFCNNTNLVSIKLPAGLAPNTMYNLFTNDVNLKTVDWNGIDTSNCTDWRGMFQKCTSLEEVDFSELDMSATANNYQSLFLNSTGMRKVFIPKESMIKPTDGTKSPFFSNGGTNIHNSNFHIYTDAVSESAQISAGQWTQYWCYYSASGKIPSTNIHFGATHQDYLDA